MADVNKILSDLIKVCDSVIDEHAGNWKSMDSVQKRIWVHDFLYKNSEKIDPIQSDIIDKSAEMAKVIAKGKDVEIKTSNGGLKVLAVDKKVVR